MVDATLAAPDLALTEQPQTHIDASVFARPNRVGISSGLEQLGAGLEDVADTAAKQQAATDLQKGVTLDANGQPQVATSTNSFIFGRAGQDYHALMVDGIRASAQMGVTNSLSDMHRQFETDPDGYQKALDGYVQVQRTNPNVPPQVANALADQAANEGARHLANLREQSMTRDTHFALQAVQTQISDGQNKLNALARQGAIDTPEYDHLSDQLMDNFDALGSNPLYGFSPDKIQSLKNSASSNLDAQYVVGRVDDAFTRKGRAEAQQILEKSVLNNPDLSLDDGERKHLYEWGMARLGYLTGEQRAVVDANRGSINTTMEALRAKPGSISDTVVDQIIAHARSIGDAEGAAQLEAVRANQPFLRATAGLNPEQAFNSAMGGGGGSEKQAMDFFVSKGWSPIQAAGIVGNLVRESGLHTGALNRGDGSDGSDSVGIGQWNGTRAVQLKQFAAQQGKSPNDFRTQLAFVQHELETSESNAAGMLRGAMDARSAASAFALGYERPQGFLTGDINQVAGGKDRVAAAMRLAGGGASSALVAGGPSSNGIPFSQAQLKANPFLASEYVRTLASNGAITERLGKTIGEGLEVQAKAGNAPDPTTLANFYQLAARNDGLLAQAEKVTTLVTANDQITTANSQGAPGAGQVIVDQAKAIATSQPSIAHTQLAEALQSSLNRQNEALQKTPFEEAARREWIQQTPAPLDLSSPAGVAAMPQAIIDRGTAASVIASRTGVAGISALAPSDLAQVKSVMSGSLDGRVALLGALTNANMPEPILRATLEKLGDDRETRPLAVAGDVAKFAPTVARDILAGQALMQVEPKLAPNKDDYPGEFAKVLPFNDLPDSAARKNYDAAIQALYAKRSAEAGDTTGILNASRLEEAVKDATGGVVDWRGGKSIAPWYGASQAQYDAAVRLVTDADLAGSRGSDGVPLPAAALKPSFSSAFGFGGNWSLQSFDGGKYLIYPNNGTMPRQYLKNAAGRNFVLDLGTKRQAVEAQGLGLALPPSSNASALIYSDEQAR